MKKRVEGARAYTIPVMFQFLHHGKAEDRLMGGMDEHVNSNEPVVEFPLVGRHTIEYTFDELLQPCLLSKFDIYSGADALPGVPHHPGRKEYPMIHSRKHFRLILFLIFALAGSRLWAQGPPYQTDDPVPVDLHHYEFYIFGGLDGTPVAIGTSGPAFEFNWGAIPRVQIHAILPWGESVPSNSAVYQPAGQGPSAFGLTDSELGVKIAFIKETKHFPQIGSFTMFELPTGSYTKGLGVGKVWYKLPIWWQKNEGKWTFDGGAGYEVVPQTDFHNFPYTGWLVKKELSERLELGAELFAHGGEGPASAQTEASAMIDVGGYYHFKHHEGEQFLFCYGHSIAGQTENYAYVGMYWTWGKDDKKDARNLLFPAQSYRNGL